MLIRSLLAVCLIVPCMSLRAADPLVTFSFYGLEGDEYELAPSQVVPEVKATSLVRGKGLNYTIKARNCFGANGWTTATEPTANDYYEFTVQPVSPVTLESLEFSEFVNPNGPRFFTVRSSLDNFTTDLCEPVALGEKPVNHRSIPLGEVFRNLSQDVTFRFIAWGAKSGGNGVWALGDPKAASTLVVNGTAGK